MTAITLTSILLIQMDKLILSYLLRLPDFGVYVVASTLATGLYILISPVLPRSIRGCAPCGARARSERRIDLYHTSSQTMAALILPLALVMACFPREALFVLTGDEALINEPNWILSFLVVGWAFNGFMNMPYALQLAAGWTKLTIVTNVVAIAVLVPITWWSASHFGVEGGAVAWLGLNLGLLYMHSSVYAPPATAWRKAALVP